MVLTPNGANMEIIKATLDDIDILTQTRIEVLRAANNLSNDIDMSKVKNQSFEYYKQALTNHTHIAYLVFDGNTFIGAGGVSEFLQRNAYIS